MSVGRDFSDTTKCVVCGKPASFFPPNKEDRKSGVLTVTFKCADGHITTKDVPLK
jgi:hypothetical protein